MSKLNTILCIFIQEKLRGHIFDYLDILETGDKMSPISFYTTLRGIFHQNLHNDGDLMVSYEEVVFVFALALLHPDLPVYIRDKYSNLMGIEHKILDFKTNILNDAEVFMSEFEDKVEEFDSKLDDSHLLELQVRSLDTV